MPFELTSVCFCRGSTVSSQKWCKLRGNLLFYFKSNDQFSEPAGVIVLEKYRVTIPSEQTETFEGYPFYIGEWAGGNEVLRGTSKTLQHPIKKSCFSTEFEDGLNQRLGSNTEQERHDWVQALRMAGYDLMRAQLQYLREQIEKRRGSHRLDVDVDMHRLQSGNQVLGDNQRQANVEDLIKF